MAINSTLAQPEQELIRSHCGVRYDAYRIAIGDPDFALEPLGQVISLTDEQEAEMIRAVGHRHGPIETLLAAHPTP